MCQKCYGVHIFPTLHEVIPFKNMKMLMNRSALSTSLTLSERINCKILLSLYNLLKPNYFNSWELYHKLVLNATSVPLNFVYTKALFLYLKL